MHLRTPLLSLIAAILVAPTTLAAPDAPATVAVTGLDGIPAADAMTMLLIDAISQIKGITLVAPKQTLSGQAVTATWTLSGSLTTKDKLWVLSVDAAGPEKAHWDWQGNDLSDAISKTCLRLTSAMDITPGSDEWKAVAQTMAAYKGRRGWDVALSGRRWLVAGQPEKAAERYRLATTVDPDRASNWLDLAKALRQAADKGRWQPAFFSDADKAAKLAKLELEAATKAAQLAPRDGQAWGELAMAQALAGAPRGAAEASLTNGTKVDSNIADLKLAAALIRDDVPSWQQALGLNPPPLDLLIYAGARAFAGGDMTTASTYYQQAHQQDPGNAAATFGLARCLTVQQKYPEALALATELTKTYPALGNWLTGTIQQASGNYKDAKTAFDAAATAQTGSAALMYYQGRIRHLLGDSIEALAYLRKALEADADLGAAAYTIGVIYQDSMSQPSTAKSYLEQAAKSLPELQADVSRRLKLIGV